ncbi:MAG: aminoacetone oxidase family FAD-binding enzyme, partial [Clostridia bacterium]|nr:aminoacetone oxidase family FAD-binding enzyme [Clostridia bacterium]
MIVVIGGGAAGMMAAISAAQNGAQVTLLERNIDLGKKLRITGKGRCNVTNGCATEDIFSNIPTNHSFLYSAIYSFTNYDVMEFFEECSVSLKEERGGRIFPKSDKAADIVNALKRKLSYLGVKVVSDRAKEILVENCTVKGVRTENTTFFCDSVILATGGRSYPQTGSDGSGYVMAEKLGHTINKIKPALVPIETYENTRALMGLSLKNIEITVFDKNGKKRYSDFGEMLFTHFGLTGPVILSSSSHMGENPDKMRVEIDLKPALSEQTLDKRILRDFEKYQNRNFENSLSDLLPTKMIDYIVEKSG